MATDPLAKVRNEVGLRVAEIRQAGPRISPMDLYARMDAIRQLAAVHGLAALEGLARRSAQMALLPGHPPPAVPLPPWGGPPAVPRKWPCSPATGSASSLASNMSRRHSTAVQT